jgi:hypothetical protein
MIPQHSNSLLADQEILWHGTDSKELYQKNLSRNRLQLEQYNWIDRPITYKFNSHGFRADKFDSTDPGVMFIGCSHTLGVGLPVESTWAHIVSSELKLKNYNLGIGGSSNDTAFRLVHYWIDQLRPDLVIFLSADRTRLELHIDDDQLYDLSVWPIGFPMIDNFTKSWLSNDTNSNMNYLKNTWLLNNCAASIISNMFMRKCRLFVQSTKQETYNITVKKHSVVLHLCFLIDYDWCPGPSRYFFINAKTGLGPFALWKCNNLY